MKKKIDVKQKRILVSTLIIWADRITGDIEMQARHSDLPDNAIECSLEEQPAAFVAETMIRLFREKIGIDISHRKIGEKK